MVSCDWTLSVCCSSHLFISTYYMHTSSAFPLPQVVYFADTCHHFAVVYCAQPWKYNTVRPSRIMELHLGSAQEGLLLKLHWCCEMCHFFNSDWNQVKTAWSCYLAISVCNIQYIIWIMVHGVFSKYTYLHIEYWGQRKSAVDVPPAKDSLDHGLTYTIASVTNSWSIVGYISQIV